MHRFLATRTVKFPRSLFWHVPFILALAAAGCSSGRPTAPAIGEAYVGPMILNLRQELAPRAPVTATVKHGDRLEILEYRRLFVKVRTQSGAEGWTDSRQLLKPAQMERLRAKSEDARSLPSQGKATPYDDRLNVHIAPYRQAPTFYQIPENESMDLIAQRVLPRIPYSPELSDSEPKAPEGTPQDAWSMVRLKDGRAGWVLSRMVMMAIPDDVAQYAEGHYITAYFSLGKIDDNGQEKHHWLWTTLQSRIAPYDFDSFRVFIWNVRRHRYETAYIERNLKGYYPVEVHALASGQSFPNFTLTFSAKDGIPYRRTYEFQGYRVRMVDKQQTTAPDTASDKAQEHQLPAEMQPPQAETLFQRWKAKLKGWMRHT